MNSPAPVWMCLTPAKNESWIIDRFLSAAATWADHVIVADQLSTDGTREAIPRAPRATLVCNDSPVFDERHRQRLLLSAARVVPGHRILIGLDADEALSANCRETAGWRRIAAAKPGTILRFRWVNVLPGFHQAWIRPGYVPFGFVDDGSEHVGRTIHSPRVPQPEGAPTLDVDDIVVLHFQYVLWDRMRSKQRWYQTWEHLRHRTKTPLQIFREYNHMHGSWGAEEMHPMQPEWLAGYDAAGIDFRSLKCEPLTWWDRELVQIMRDEGPARLSKLAIWDHDWEAAAVRAGIAGGGFKDPRSPWEKTMHRLLHATQNNRGNLLVRVLESFLRRTGW